MIWDVHEDTAAELSTKPWLPRPLRPPAAVAVRTAERMAERYVHLILAGPRPRSSRPRRRACWGTWTGQDQEFAGAGAPLGGSAVAAIESLASFAGAASVSYSGPVVFGVS